MTAGQKEADGQATTGGSEWALGLFDWLLATRYDGCELCCNILFCSPCMAGYMHNAHFSKKEGVMNQCLAGWLFTADILGFAASAVLGLFVSNYLCFSQMFGYCATASYSLYLRRAIVAESKIQESACMSCLTVFLCLPCAECQHFAQIDSTGIYPGGCFCLRLWGHEGGAQGARAGCA
eukprot:TRINITY_DN7018_c0_g1_i1.p1 TRINITY_DN7018_c0_g1~~TRINITY_DN7018_c0_g1_i1.p1  ORF type:complete len:179 (+),score=21.37 TRINITY_DN7018_c0_g1_i1:68-604(+)